jgi:hypothetical protein
MLLYSDVVFLQRIYLECHQQRWVICSKVICSKNLLDTKISIAQHCLSRCQKNETAQKNPKSHIEQMHVLDQNDQLLKLQKNFYQLLKNKMWYMYGILLSV